MTTVFKWSLPHSRYIVRSHTFPALKLSKSQCSYMTGVSFLESDTAAFLIGFKTRSVFTARHEYRDKVNKEKYTLSYIIYIYCSMQYRGLRLKASSGLVVMLLSLSRYTKNYLWSVTSTLTRWLWNGTPLPERKGIIAIRNKWEINICL